MHELPAEVVSSILDEAYYKAKNSQDDTPDYSTLCACALVDSTWNNAAQILLFRSAILNDKFNSYFLAPGNSRPPQSHPLLQHVRVMRITEPEFPGTQDDLGEAIVAVLSACTGLYELVIGAPGPIAFSDVDMAKLYRLSQSRTLPLRSLRLHKCGVQSMQLHQLLSALPTIEFLFVGSEVGRQPLQQTSVCNARIYDLRLSRNFSVDLLRWLLQSSEGHLQILELRDVPGRAMKDVLAPYCPSIRSLRLMPFNHISVQILNMCTSLEELVLMNIPYIFPIPPLPPSFKHLTLFVLTAGGPRVTLTPIVNLVKTHPGMQSLRCNPITKSVRGFKALEEECTANGVSLDADSIVAWPVEPSVKATVFPRRRSISNFALMTGQ